MGTLREAIDSPQIVSAGESSTYTVKLFAHDYSTVGAVVAAVKAANPRNVTVDGYVLNAPRNINVTPIGTGNDDKYKVNLRYSYKEGDDNDQEEGDEEAAQEDEGTSNIQFSFGKGQGLTDTALKGYHPELDPPTSTLDNDGPGYVAERGTYIDAQWVLNLPPLEDEKGNIVGGATKGSHPGDKLIVNSDGTLEPVEIIKGKCTFTLKKTWQKDELDNDKFHELLNRVGKINSKSWRSLEPHCVIFNGVDGQQEPDGTWPLTYQFEYRRPEDFSVQRKQKTASREYEWVEIVKLKDIPGFDYVWTQFTQKPDDDAMPPAAGRVCVAVVYEEFNFTALGLDEE